MGYLTKHAYQLWPATVAIRNPLCGFAGFCRKLAVLTLAFSLAFVLPARAAMQPSQGEPAPAARAALPSIRPGAGKPGDARLPVPLPVISVPGALPGDNVPIVVAPPVPSAAPAAAAAEAPSARAELGQAQGLAKSAAAAAPDAVKAAATLDGFWSGRRLLGLAVPVVPGAAFLAAQPVARDTVLVLGAGAATYGVHRLARAGIDKLAKRRQWDENRQYAARRKAALIIWGLGAAVLLHATVGATGLISSLGLGSIGVTIACRDLIGNFLEHIKLLWISPFTADDSSILIGDQVYEKVKALNLFDLMLQDDKHWKTPMTYTYLAGKPITLRRAYIQEKKLRVAHMNLAFKDAWEAVTATPRSELKKGAVWLLGSGAIFLLASALQPHLGLAALAAAFPWLKAAAIMAVARSLAHGLNSLILRLGKAADWSIQGTEIARLVLTCIAFLVGATAAMKVLGIGWASVAAYFGLQATTLVYASWDVLGALYQYVKWSGKLELGQVVKVAGATGKIIAKNLQYLVLAHKDNAHTLVPFSLLGSSLLSITDDPAGADTTAPKPAEPKDKTK